MAAILTDVGEAGVGRVGVVGDDRDPRRQCALDGIVERLEVDDRNRDPVGVGGDRGFEGVDHLGVVGPLGSGPLELRAEQGRRVLDVVLGRDEERVRRHVVDEDEVPLRRVGEVPTYSAPTATAVVVGRVVIVVTAATHEESRGRCDPQRPQDLAPRVQWTVHLHHVPLRSRPPVNRQSCDD